MTDSPSESADSDPQRRRRRRPGKPRKQCARQGCGRMLPQGETRYPCCSFLCTSVLQELERAQRLSQATGDTEHWLAVVALNDALTDYFRSDRRLYLAAQEVGITDKQWHAIKNGATA